MLQKSLDDPESLLAEAKEILINDFSLFGLNERYSEFLIMVNKLLGWRDIFYVRKNTSKRDSRSAQIIESHNFSDEAIDIIRDRNYLDIQLYKFAQELFSKRWQQLHLDHTHVQKYEEINADYKLLLEELKSL